MFQISSVKTRYFEFEAPDNLQVIHIEPPKLKTLKRLSGLAKNASVAELSDVIARIISKNKEGRKVNADLVALWMDPDQLSAFISEFLGWLNKAKTNDPN